MLRITSFYPKCFALVRGHSAEINISQGLHNSKKKVKNHWGRELSPAHIHGTVRRIVRGWSHSYSSHTRPPTCCVCVCVCVCVCACVCVTDQLLVQAQGAVVLVRVGPRVQSRRQRQGEGVAVGELPDAGSDVHAETGDLGGRGCRGGGGRRRRRRRTRRGGGDGRLGNGTGVPVSRGPVRGRRGELPGRAGQRPSLQPPVGGGAGSVGAVRRGRGEIPQCRGEGEGLVFVVRRCLEGRDGDGERKSKK